MIVGIERGEEEEETTLKCEYSWEINMEFYTDISSKVMGVNHKLQLKTASQIFRGRCLGLLNINCLNKCK